ncbi:MAG: hydroxyacylglutathione hydrolase [Betaproteobacteria bacterium]|nr:hydroxyacylglutathione hydrolase [Betaproteobacteria bacterium]
MVEIVPVPAFEDNYIWVIRRGARAAVVDPGDGAPVLEYFRREGIRPVAILNTHHHGDHVGGNDEILAEYPVPVYGPAAERIATVTHPLRENDVVSLPDLELDFRVLEVPGHTAGHIAYYGANLLFCGDTLFAGGCGRLFEGTAEQMHRSLAKLAALPGDTGVYCAHEYTLANLRFAKAVEPANGDLLARDAAEQEKRRHGVPTVPSTIEVERATNPFLRCHVPAVVQAAETHAGKALAGPVAVFATLRTWKNNFR